MTKLYIGIFFSLLQHLYSILFGIKNEIKLIEANQPEETAQK